MCPHIGEIGTVMLVYEQDWVIQHTKAPASVKIELPDLWKNEIYDDVENHLFVNSFSPWYGDTVWNITITKGITILLKVLFHIIAHFSYNKRIWGWAETSFGLCSSSAKNLPKITLCRNLNTLGPKHSLPGWQMKDIGHTYFFCFMNYSY